MRAGSILLIKRSLRGTYQRITNPKLPAHLGTKLHKYYYYCRNFDHMPFDSLRPA